MYLLLSEAIASGTSSRARTLPRIYESFWCSNTLGTSFDNSPVPVKHSKTGLVSQYTPNLTASADTATSLVSNLYPPVIYFIHQAKILNKCTSLMKSSYQLEVAATNQNFVQIH